MPESHPALLTVGGDAVLRFWVEVTLQPLLGSDGCDFRAHFLTVHACPLVGNHFGHNRLQVKFIFEGGMGCSLVASSLLYAPTNPGLKCYRCMCKHQGIKHAARDGPCDAVSPPTCCCRAVPLDSHFCCTLVIEPPPGASTAALPEGQLQACWGMPDQTHLPGKHNVWLHTVHASAPPCDCASRGGAVWPRQQQLQCLHLRMLAQSAMEGTRYFDKRHLSWQPFPAVSADQARRYMGLFAGHVKRGSTVQWVMATGTSPSGADNLWLWAIDGAYPFLF